MKVFWWVYFGALFFVVLTGIISFFTLRHRYMRKHPNTLSPSNWLFLNQRLFRDMLFSRPQWIECDAFNKNQHRVYRGSFFGYLIWVFGFLLLSLVFS